ncbi:MULTISPECIES: AAA family ATPase [Shewanella]|nr:AAA family ATPase [Shewanella putrefaciens]
MASAVGIHFVKSSTDNIPTPIKSTMKVSTDYLFVYNTDAVNEEGSCMNSPMYHSLIGVQHDFLPKFLPEDMECLDACLTVAFTKAKLEANRVIEDYEGFGWDELLNEDNQTYRENKEFLEKYKRRLELVNEAEAFRERLDVFGKFKLMNYLSLLAERVIYDYRAFTWTKYHGEDAEVYRENKNFFLKYLARTREISIESRSKENNDIIKNHINNLRVCMDEKNGNVPFIPPARQDLSSTQPRTKVDSEANCKELDTLQSELNSMIGLNVVKDRISSLVREIAIRKEREAHGLPTGDRSYHMVFTGNSGTGKTVVARIVAQMFYALGLTRSNTFVEATRSDLVAGYVGHTAIKTNEVVDRALGGVLFIDEAYALNGEGNDFGAEAINTLLKRMEDDRGDLVIIMAGYENEISRLLSSNQGLESRFNRKIHFEDYSISEMVQILKRNITVNGYSLSGCVSDNLLDILLTSAIERHEKFSNGRGVRNLFEKIVENQEKRLYQSGDLKSVSKSDLQTISLEDVMSLID